MRKNVLNINHSTSKFKFHILGSEKINDRMKLVLDNRSLSIKIGSTIFHHVTIQSNLYLHLNHIGMLMPCFHPKLSLKK